MLDSVTKYYKIWNIKPEMFFAFLEKRKEYDINIFVSSKEKNA
jgi:hypothetical protein